MNKYYVLSDFEAYDMEVTAWNNGHQNPTGSGYGFKLSAHDRDTNFQRDWKTIFVLLPGLPRAIEVNVEKKSFWNSTCRELISKELGQWMIHNKYAPWSSGTPPKFRLYPDEGNHFRLEI